MPRRRSVGLIRNIGVDVRFKSFVVQKLINMVMRCGKKNIARAAVYGAFDIISKKVGGDEKKVYGVFEKAVGQIKPYVEVRSRRVGGGIYQVPVEVRSERTLALGLRWLIDASLKRTDSTMSSRLAKEILDASTGQGGAVKKKMDVHRMAEANRAFSHYAW